MSLSVTSGRLWSANSSWLNGNLKKFMWIFCMFNLHLDDNNRFVVQILEVFTPLIVNAFCLQLYIEENASLEKSIELMNVRLNSQNNILSVQERLLSKVG